MTFAPSGIQPGEVNRCIRSGSKVLQLPGPVGHRTRRSESPGRLTPSSHLRSGESTGRPQFPNFTAGESSVERMYALNVFRAASPSSENEIVLPSGEISVTVG